MDVSERRPLASFTMKQALISSAVRGGGSGGALAHQAFDAFERDVAASGGSPAISFARHMAGSAEAMRVAFIGATFRCNAFGRDWHVAPATVARSCPSRPEDFHPEALTICARQHAFCCTCPRQVLVRTGDSLRRSNMSYVRSRRQTGSVRLMHPTRTFSVLDRMKRFGKSSLVQILWTMQFPPAAFRVMHAPVAASAEVKGPTRAR